MGKKKFIFDGGATSREDEEILKMDEFEKKSMFKRVMKHPVTYVALACFFLSSTVYWYQNKKFEQVTNDLNTRIGALEQDLAKKDMPEVKAQVGIPEDVLRQFLTKEEFEKWRADARDYYATITNLEGLRQKHDRETNDLRKAIQENAANHRRLETNGSNGVIRYTALSASGQEVLELYTSGDLIGKMKIAGRYLPLAVVLGNMTSIYRQNHKLKPSQDFQDEIRRMVLDGIQYGFLTPQDINTTFSNLGPNVGGLSRILLESSRSTF